MTNVLSRPAPPESSVDYDPLIEAYRTPTQDISLVTIGNVLLRHRWLLIFATVFGFVIFAFANYRPDKTYTATTTFAPRSGAQNSISAGSVLSQLGIGGATGGNGGAYYMEVIRSPRILAPVVEHKYSFPTGTGVVSKSLIEIWGLSYAPPNHARAAAVGRLVAAITTNTGAGGGGIMKVSVTTEDAVLSALITRRILEEINRFNLETRQEHASAERQFVEARVVEARVALLDAENALQNFTNENQIFQPNSRLALEWDRLDRNVDLRQGLYTNLARALDQAKIDEVRNSPVITVIEKAEVPLGPDPVVWPKKAILGALIGLFLGGLIAFVHTYIARTRETYSDDYTELARLKRETGNDMRKPWRPIANIIATGRP